MAEVRIYNSLGISPFALDMNQIDISAWLEIPFASLQFNRQQGYWIAEWLGDEHGTRLFGYDLSIAQNGPRGGDIWAIQHLGPGFQMNIYSFGLFPTNDLLSLIRSDSRQAFWSAILDGADELYGTQLNDRVFGWDGNDRITTAAGDDTIRGGQGRDTIIGGDGADVINGDDGDDRISGNAGRDRLTGGSGVDSFVFSSPPNAGNRDRITDFTPGEDLILLSRATFSLNGSSGQGLQAENFHYGASATEDTHRILYDPATGNLIRDRDGSGPLGSSVIATLDAGLVIAASSFVLTD